MMPFGDFLQTIEYQASILSQELADAKLHASYDRYTDTDSLSVKIYDGHHSFPAIPSAVLCNVAIIGSPAIIAQATGSTLYFSSESMPYQHMLWEARNLSAKSITSCTTSAVSSAFNMCRYWSGTLWHWVFETFIYAIFAFDNGFGGCFLIPDSAPFFRQSLEAFNVPSDRIIEKNTDIVLVDKLFTYHTVEGKDLLRYPSLIIHINNRAQSLFGIKKFQKRRIYIARRETRLVVNETEVMNLLQCRGFEMVFMEDYSFIEQVEMAVQCECIAGPHGAGLSAALFMRPGGTLIEFFAPTYINPCLDPVSQTLGLTYHMLVSRVYQCVPYEYGFDIRVDLFMLARTLRTLSV